MGCPKCGYRGHNKVYHWGTQEIECESCGHDYPKYSENKKKEDFDGSFLFKPARLNDKEIRMSNDVYVWGGYNNASKGIRPVGGVHVGKLSGDDDYVRNINGNIVGKITGSGHFTSHWW